MDIKKIETKIKTNELKIRKLENENENWKLEIFKTKYTFKKDDILVYGNRKVRFIDYDYESLYGITKNVFNVVNIKKDGTDGVNTSITFGFSGWKLNVK